MPKKVFFHNLTINFIYDNIIEKGGKKDEKKMKKLIKLFVFMFVVLLLTNILIVNAKKINPVPQKLFTKDIII